ncbi:uncharacterized protein LOC110733951 [Chenopodium quinoa]|uniref:uncharacterized protein LOC110733951 n=1 Tax=Chenopodium quinoa TaxID=63459 RepID=UPI000B777D34|nr:uncharacterized protein LOC110733951 [Chenopodium quinoa]
MIENILETHLAISLPVQTVEQKGSRKRKVRPIVDLGELSSETVMLLPTDFQPGSRPVGGGGGRTPVPFNGRKDGEETICNAPRVLADIVTKKGQAGVDVLVTPTEENVVVVMEDNPINVHHVDKYGEILRSAHGHPFANYFEVPIQDCEEVKKSRSSWKPCSAEYISALSYSDATWHTVPVEVCEALYESKKWKKRDTIGENLPVGPLVLESAPCCLYCNAKKFMYETPSFCCCGGQVVIAANQFPDELCRLYLSEEEDAKHFRQYSRMYNNLFAFSSIRGKTESKTYKGIYVFKMHGQVYHCVPDLLPHDGSPKFLQLYFYDGQHEVQNRVNCFPEVREDIICVLMKITEMNPYARFFRSLREIEIDENTQIVLSQNTILDQRVYNAPVSDEVAIVWPDGASSSQISTPHIIVHGKSAQTHRICHYYGCYDPLQYPLLFPFGECGWTQNLKKRNVGGKNHTKQVPDPINSCAVHTLQNFLDEEESRTVKHKTRANKYISPREYYAYILQMRSTNMLLRSGRCFQQFVVDIVTGGETNASKIGHLVVLPPSFIRCPRDLKRRYLNAMELVQRYGKPDLFITMTCNENWPEIKCELQPGEKAQDRPDIVARIFRAKLLALKKQTKKERIFGEVAAMIYVVKFQKRGLPHAHFLIILKRDFKIRGPSEYDKFVCAEIPSFDNPRLRKFVLTHMMHGPCGKLNPKCPCMKMDGKKLVCKNGYPKYYNLETANNKDGYPIYRRRQTGEKVKVRRAELDNQRVSPCEGIWRIFGFDLYEIFPPVMSLPAHLPNMQSIAVRPFENLSWVVRDPKRARTPLTEYFAMNATIDGGVNLLYNDFSKHYTWNSSVKEWKDRKNALTVVGRISFVLPSEGERYYLRLLLLNVQNSNSFTDLCTVDNYVCATFQETAKRLGLLENDDAASICLTEAA